MANRQILVGMAATFVGLTALLVVAGVVVNPLLIALAVPFGAVAYVMWYHASGKLRERVRREADRAGPEKRERARRRARTSENRRAAYGATGTGSPSGAGRASANGRYAGDARDRAQSANRMSARAAYDTLDVVPSADESEVRAAYREKAKRLHPDGDDGDEEAFKQLNEAYEVLQN